MPADNVNATNVEGVYEAVRDDSEDSVRWAILKYDANTIDVDSKGVEFDDFKNKISECDRAFGYVRVTVGDELSRRDKFVLITWAGPGISPMNRGKLSGDKANVKKYFRNFALEIHTDSLEEINQEYLKDELRKVGGANYGTGQRD